MSSTTVYQRFDNFSSYGPNSSKYNQHNRVFPKFSCRPVRLLKQFILLSVFALITSLFLALFGFCNSLPDTTKIFNRKHPISPDNSLKDVLRAPVIPDKVATAPSLLKHVAEDSEKQTEKNSVKKQNLNLKQKNKRDQTFHDYVYQQDVALKNAAQVLTAVKEVKEAIKDHDHDENKFIKSIFTLQKPEKIQPYDISKGTPRDPEVKKKRDKIVEMTKHAWDSYVKYAWTHNELKPVSKLGHSQNIFGNAKTGATIIDSLDTLYLMGLKEEFKQAEDWVFNDFQFNSRSELSVFETNIRFIGGLLSTYYLTGDIRFVHKARNIAAVLLPAFETKTGLPFSMFNPATKAMKNYAWASSGCSVLSEVGTLHMEFGLITHLTNDTRFLDKVLKIREFLRKHDRPDSGVYYNFIHPQTGAWGRTIHASVGALGDSFYEYLIKTYLLTAKTDTIAKTMYEDSLRGIKNVLLKQGPGGHWYLGELKRSRTEAKMGHLTCFAGGMFALGAKHTSDEKYWMEKAIKLGESCRLSYAQSPIGIGPEAFRFDNEKDAGKPKMKNEKFYVLRPEVIETYFYLWRYTKDQRWRDYGWEAAMAINKHCRVDGGFSGIKDVTAAKLVLDDTQQSFLLAETFKYLFLLFSDDDLINLDEWVFNTEAHPFKILPFVDDAKNSELLSDKNK